MSSFHLCITCIFLEYCVYLPICTFLLSMLPVPRLPRVEVFLRPECHTLSKPFGNETTNWHGTVKVRPVQEIWVPYEARCDDCHSMKS